MTRSTPYTETHTGGKFYFTKLDKNTYTIADIAVGLSRESRFNGQYTKDIEFYSVAEHCVLMARWCLDNDKPKFAKVALMHDAAEAYIKDLPAPLKCAMPSYKLLDDLATFSIFKQFKLEYFLNHPFINKLDVLMLNAEREQIMVDTGNDWLLPYDEALDIKVRGWLPGRARYEFINMYYTLWGVE